MSQYMNNLSGESLPQIMQLDFPSDQWENIPPLIQSQFLLMNRQIRQVTQFLAQLGLPEKQNELQLKIDSLQQQYKNFTSYTYMKDQENIENHLKQIDQQIGQRINLLQAETNNLQKASKLIHINPVEDTEQFQQNSKNFDHHFSKPVNTEDFSQKTQFDNAKAIWNMINTFIIDSHIPSEIKKIEEKIQEQKMYFDKKLAQQIQPKINEQGEQIKALDTNLIHKEKKLLFQIEQINQNDFQGMKQQIRESKEYLQKSQQFQITQTQTNNNLSQSMQEITLDYNTKLQKVQKDSFEFQRKIEQVKSITENMIQLFQQNAEDNSQKQQKTIHDCITRIQKLENFYSQELGSINQQMELNQKQSFQSLKEEVELINKKISKNQKDSYQELQKLENAINDIFPRFKIYQQKNKDFEAAINNIISLSQQELKNNIKMLIKEQAGGSDDKVKSLEEMIENLINLLHQNIQDKLSNPNQNSVPMVIKDNSCNNSEASPIISNSLNTPQILLDDQGKKSSNENSSQEKEELITSIHKSQKLDNVKYLSELHQKPLILKSPLKFNSSLKKANESLSRTEIQIMLQDQSKLPIHSKQKAQTSQTIRLRNNSLGITQSSSQSPVKLIKLSQTRGLITEENNSMNDMSKSFYPRFNTTTSDSRRNNKSLSQDYVDFSRAKQGQGDGLLNSDHILYMELEAFKQQFSNQRKDNQKRSKWSNSGSPNN